MELLPGYSKWPGKYVGGPQSWKGRGFFLEYQRGTCLFWSNQMSSEYSYDTAYREFKRLIALFLVALSKPADWMAEKLNLRTTVTNNINFIDRFPYSLRFNGHFPGGPGLAGTRMSPLLIFIGAKGDGGGGINWSYRGTKFQLNHHHQQKEQPTFYRLDALPVTQPTVSKNWREIDFSILCFVNCEKTLYCKWTWYWVTNFLN